MKVLCAFGRYQYGDPKRGLSLESSSFIPALERLGHHVSLFDSWIQGVYASNADLNRRLLKMVEDLRPDVLFTVVRDVEIWKETLDVIRHAYAVTAITWATDDTWKFRQVSRYIGKHYDGVVTTYADAVATYHAHGIGKVHVSQWAANQDWLAEPRKASECRYQVSFVGIAYGDRQMAIEFLRRKGIEVTCFGYRWPSGSVSAEEIPRIMRDSVISLSFSKGLYGGPNQIKARVFEVPGAGGFLLTEDAPGLPLWYAVGGEIDAFRDLDELAAHIQKYLSDPGLRDKMAELAHQRTRQQHTYEDRMRGVMAFASSLPHRAGDGSEWVRFSSANLRHRTGPVLKTARAVLLLVCRIIWGKSRAWACARRISFELSWRLAGPRSFRASGWVGRMFPY